MNFLKTLLFKLLKIETKEQKYQRFASNHEMNKKLRKEYSEKIAKLVKVHNELADSEFKDQVADRIESIVSKQKAAEEILAQNEMILSSLKITLQSQGHLV